jgi:membrane protein implicated in regulation of membrane protease activity
MDDFLKTTVIYTQEVTAMHTKAFRRVTETLMQLLPLGSEDSYKFQGTVFDLITPDCAGYIKFRGSLWRARCLQQVSLEPGTLVRAIDRQGLTLIVEPISRYVSSFNMKPQARPYADE